MEIAVKSWNITEKEVRSTTDLLGEKYILAEYPLNNGPESNHIHVIPVSGIAYRMEVLGLHDPSEVLDITLKEMNVPPGSEIDGVYAKTLESYYTASTEVARAIVENNPQTFMDTGSQVTEDDIIDQVRMVLKGGQENSLRSMSVNAVSQVAASLSSVRQTSIDAIRSSQTDVTVQDNDSVNELRSALTDMHDDLDTMTDEYAHRAMETGAYYYAKMFPKRGS